MPTDPTLARKKRGVICLILRYHKMYAYLYVRALENTHPESVGPVDILNYAATSQATIRSSAGTSLICFTQKMLYIVSSGQDVSFETRRIDFRSRIYSLIVDGG